MSELTWPTGGGRVTQVVTRRVRVQPPRRMKAITGEVEALLDGLNEDSRRSGALLASELVAQVVGRVPGSQSGPHPSPACGSWTRLRHCVTSQPGSSRCLAELPSPNPLGGQTFLLWSFLDNSQNILDLNGIPKEIIQITQGVVVLSVVVAYELVRRYGLRLQQRQVGAELAAQARKTEKAEVSA